MEDETIKKIREQHVANYRNAILENVKNNTNVLVDEDIMSLVRKPPLDSMDLIKSKFLDLAKKNKIILNTEKLDEILDKYRNDIINCFDKIKDLRISELSLKIRNTKFENGTDIIRINKKDFGSINKQVKKIVKDQLKCSFERELLNNINKIFVADTSEEIKNKVILDIAKYINSGYKKQLLENIDIKILVKDTTLINGAKEQSDRYLFMLKNSRLLNDNFNE